MAITQQAFDNLQFNLQGALDDILRLKARVTALEGGEVLPPDQSVAPDPQSFAPVTCEQVLAVHPAAAAEPEIDTELDITRGMTAGGRRP